MPVTKEEVGAEEKRPTDNEEIRVRKDAGQDNDCNVDGGDREPWKP